jgi:hypothetical protein
MEAPSVCADTNLVELAGSLLGERLDFDKGVAVGDTSTPFGESVIGQAVGTLSVGMLVSPPSERDGRDAGSQPLGDANWKRYGRTIVPDPRRRAIRETACGGILGIHLDERVTFDGAVLWQM